MLTLRSSPTSPFGRKVKLAALVTGHSSKMTVVVADTMSADDPLRSDNPLGKIPCLALADGTTLYDSRVIIEWMDHDAGGNCVIPSEWSARIASLKMQALADGVMDAAILQLYEGRFRDAEKHEQRWLDHQRGKVERGLAAIEAIAPIASAKPEVGAISVACMLDWLDFRFSTLASGQYPRLTAFLAGMNKTMPHFADTKPRL
ncbi:Gst Glutathione S-transferase [Rhabdaerophilaceae bacterium]